MSGATTTKDNANPIIHRRAGPSSGTSSGLGGVPSSSSQTSKTGRRGISGVHAQDEAEDDTDEWWRDEGVHSRTGGLMKMGSVMQKRRKDSGISMDLDEDGEEGNRRTVDAAFKGEDREDIDADEVFDLIRSIHDPEHPLTLEELAVVNASHITVTHPDDYPTAPRYPCVRLEFTPTIPHCSLATLIGLSLRVRLLQSLPPSYKVDISIRPGTHQSENAINKQLGDKERVAAALENEHLLGVVRGCLENAARRGRTEEEWERRVEDLARELGVAV